MADIATVVDEPANSRFRYTEDGLDAELVYRAGDNELILVHTEVPDQLSGRGIASHLVRAAVDRAVASGETVLPWCPFARRWCRTTPTSRPASPSTGVSRPGSTADLG